MLIVPNHCVFYIFPCGRLHIHIQSIPVAINDDDEIVDDGKSLNDNAGRIDDEDEVVDGAIAISKNERLGQEWSRLILC